VSAIAYYLEGQGLATTGISLVREHTAAMRPPRSLWVPFPLGRPLGVPGDGKFQHAVIARALALLDEPSGPLLVDFEADAPSLSHEQGTDSTALSWSCPVSFPAPVTAMSQLHSAVQRELSELEPWYARAHARRGRTTVGAQPLSVSDAMMFLVRLVETGAVERPDALAAFSRVQAVKLAVEDVKAFYLEAALAQPASDVDAVHQWFWGDTSGAQLVRAVADTCRQHSSASLRAIADAALVPRWARHLSNDVP
jgi:hypothetical protein